MGPESRVHVAGHRGLVGSAIVRRLEREGYARLILRSREELDLLDQSAVHRFYREERVDYVFMAAGKVGGIAANAESPASFLYENMVMAANVIHAAAEAGVEKLVYLGSSCIYPKHAPQPIAEDALLTGPLEPTNEGYAVAKIAGLKLCEAFQRQYGKRFVSAMPTNLYGPGDNFHPDHSHVAAGLMRRMHEAKSRGDGEVVVWGSGEPRRELLHVDDLAEALLVVMLRYEGPTPINVGTGEDCSIRELAELIREVVGYGGALTFDRGKPDGTPRKVLDVARIRALGFRPKIPLRLGLEEAYRWAVAEGVLA